MKKFIFIILFIIIVLIGFFIYKSNKTEHPNYSSNYTAEKTSTSTNNINTTNSDNNTTNTNSIETEENETYYALYSIAFSHRSPHGLRWGRQRRAQAQ